MPIYVFRCELCGYIHEEVKPYSDSDESACTFCGGKANRAHDKETVQVRGDIEPGYNVSLGKYVTSRRDVREEAAKFNAAVPDLMTNSYPSSGRLTKEERVELEQRETVLTKRGKGSWGSNPSDADDGIAVEGKANYDEIRKAVKVRHGWRDK